MLFWAPFMLVHLGGQETITAFSKHDNELWTRHLLSLVTQTVVAGYIVSKSSWPDGRLWAAMVLMFLCGFLKYAGRTYCLYAASPKNLRASSMSNLWHKQLRLRNVQGEIKFGSTPELTFEVMFYVDKCWEYINIETLQLIWPVDDIMLVDAPVDDLSIATASIELPQLLKEKSLPERCTAYQYVAASLGQSYRWLYTKAPHSNILMYWLSKIPDGFFGHMICGLFTLTYTLFQCISTAIALLLFAAAQKEGHHRKADMIVSYILLVGALVLDLLPAFTSIVSYARRPFRPGTVADCGIISVVSCVQPPGWRTRNQWSEELAQYCMTRRNSTSVEDYHGCIPSIWKWILKFKPLLGAWCVEFLDLTWKPVTDDLKLFVLDKLLFLQTRRQEWDFANFSGQRAFRNWKDSRQVQFTQLGRLSTTELDKSLSSIVEFSARVLIWHIATEICYFSEHKGHDDIQNDETRTLTIKRKKWSRELSQYIMYLVFKCDVLLTSNARLLHYKAHEGLTEILLNQSATANLDEKKGAIKVFDVMEEEKQKHGVSFRPQALQSTEEALPRAHAVAQELIGIDDEADRWHLISEVWLEMFFYIAPCCGPDFHYEHLSTGGEFISHVLLLMRSLGPFMPKSGA